MSVTHLSSRSFRHALLTAILLLACSLQGWSTEYQLVTSATELEVGANYIIGSAEIGSAVFMSNAANSNTRPLSASATVTSSMVTLASDMLVLKLGTFTDYNVSYWTFYTQNYAGTAGYLNAIKTTTNDYLQVVAAFDSYAEFSIIFSDKNHIALIKSDAKTSYNVLRYNSSSSCFSFDTGAGNVYLFKEVKESLPTSGTLTFAAKNTAGYWATFSSDRNVVLPATAELADGTQAPLTVYAVTTSGSNLTLTSPDNCSNGTNWHLPADNGYLLFVATSSESAPSVTYTFEETSAGTAPASNMLHPASEAMTGDYTFYKLAYNNYTAKTGLGFYWGDKSTTNNGSAFSCKAGTAYLAVQNSGNAPTHFSFEEEESIATGISAATNNDDVIKFIENGQLFIRYNGVIYNALGQLVK